MQTLEGLELRGYTCGEGADRDIADVAKEVLDAYFFCFFGFDYRGCVHEGFGCGCAVLNHTNILLASGCRLSLDV